MIRSIVIASALLASGLSVTPAIAQEVRTAAVVIRDADFATPVARADLDRRIAVAAEQVCGSNAAAENSSWGQIKACRTQVRAEMLAASAPLRSVQLSSK